MKNKSQLEQSRDARQRSLWVKIQSLGGALAAFLARRFACDLRALALFRLGLGVILLADLAMRAVDLEAFYTDFGVLPGSVFLEKFMSEFHFSLHLANGTFGWQALLFALAALAAFLLLVGWRTRLMTCLSWVLLLSLQNRNPMILNGGDVLLRLLLFWGMFLPLGHRFSIDAALSSARHEGEETLVKNRIVTAATIGLTLQAMIIYLTTAILKSGPEWWPDGTASYYALALDSFVTPLGKLLQERYALLQMSTFVVLGIEMIGPLLLVAPVFFVPARLTILMLFAGMHLNFDLAMRLGLFPYVDILLLVALIPGEFFDWFERRIHTQSRSTWVIRYDGACGFCQKMALLIREALLMRVAKVAPVQDDADLTKTMRQEHSWMVIDPEGKPHLRWDGFVSLMAAAPFWGPGGRLLRRVVPSSWGDAAYNVVARRRELWAPFSARFLPILPLPSPKASWPMQLVASFFVIYIALLNVRSLPMFHVEMSEAWLRISYVLRLDQKWNMFAPFPLKEDGWYVIDGQLKDQTKVDVLRGKVGAASFEKPALVAYDVFENARWRKYLMNIWQKSRAAHRLYYGRYLCRAWNRHESFESRRLQAFEIFFMKELTKPPGQPPELTRVSIWKHDCFKASPSASPALPQTLEQKDEKALETGA